MSKAAPIPRHPSKSKPLAKKAATGYLPDRVAGGLAMATDVLGLALMGMSLRGLGQAHLAPTREALVSGASIALGLLAHFGVYRGARWGFVLAAALAAWGLVDLGVPHGLRVVLSTNLWMLLYAAFRLGSVYGPKGR